jgi:protein-L-isoaspartate(D-aspartate) O-methyltransferase
MQRADGTQTIDRRADELRTELIDALAAAGALPDPAWREAFAEVPRHLFVPHYYEISGVRTGRDNRTESWLHGVHTDRALVTRRWGGEPVSSSSQPSLMATMLDQLEVTDNSRVLEVGTGTGYNAALLAHRLGDSKVTSVDVVPELTAAARAHLADAGYQPVVVTADGGLGWAERAPYDRIIATCRIDRVPPPWLEQLNEGGLIVAPLGLALVKLRRTGDQRGEGRFLGEAYFMPLRTAAELHPHPKAPAEPSEKDRRPAALPPEAVGDTGFRFLASLLEPGLTWRADLSDAPQSVCVRADDGSTAHRYPDGTVAEAGPRKVWTRLEAAHRDYAAAGRPGPERYGITVDGPRQSLWLDSPDGPHWVLPESRG